MIKNKDIDFSNIRKQLGLTQKEIAELLNVSVNYVSLMENKHKPITKKIKTGLFKLLEKSNNDKHKENPDIDFCKKEAVRYQSHSERLLQQMSTAQPSKPFADRMRQSSFELSFEEQCAQIAWDAYCLARSLGLEGQVLTLMGQLKRAIEQPDNTFATSEVTRILDRIRRRDYPQYKEPET